MENPRFEIFQKVSENKLNVEINSWDVILILIRWVLTRFSSINRLETLKFYCFFKLILKIEFYSKKLQNPASKMIFQSEISLQNAVRNIPIECDPQITHSNDWQVNFSQESCIIQIRFMRSARSKNLHTLEDQKRNEIFSTIQFSIGNLASS